ncbi:aspartate carbamoyltransferase regulatory subunit [Patescibacteria group bacterium]|nr:MAG: aspartate carbamoyltransferase regulatory subunit [Patescibacteria group bacterium]
MKEKKLLVNAIKNGTVIDHITAGSALKIIRILNLASHEKVVTVGLNLPSKSMGRKDLIKVAERELSPDEVSSVAILAPQASINIVKNYEIVKKFKIKLPEKIESVVVCPNPKCITNHEPMASVFFILPNGKHIKLRCKYCEKVFGHDDIREYRV